MKAIRIHEYNGPEVLQYEDIDVPEIAVDEILIRTYASGVNPVDWKVRTGYLKDMIKLPFTLGYDVAGQIIAVGEQIKNFNKGDEVFAFIDLSRGGGYAEYTVLKENELTIKPKSLDFAHAAAVPLAALSAWQALFDQAHLQAGQKILIHAGAGGVGHFALQLAKWKGAHTITTASESNKQFLLEHGADEVIDYKKEDFSKVLKDKIDVVFDTMGGDVQARSWPLLNDDGVLVSIVDGKQVEEQKNKFKATGKYFRVTPNQVELQKIAELIDQGILKPFVSETMPLKDAAKAQKLSEEKHTRGKIVLTN